jgi:hypothetical protein
MEGESLPGVSSPTPPPPFPDEGAFQLSDEEIHRLQKILNDEGGYQYSEIEAKYRGLELLELFRMLMDPEADEARRQRPPAGSKMAAPPLSPPPVPQPFPIRLDADHRYEVESNLRMLEHELGRVKQFPTSWRWAVVAAYNVLGHALALKHPTEPRDPSHHLLELFDATALQTPENRDAREAVRQLEVLRTAWLSRPVNEWPLRTVSLAALVRDIRILLEGIQL